MIMNAKTQKNLVIALAYGALASTLATINPNTGLRWKLVTVAFLALALLLNCLVLYMQVRRNKKRKLSYYFGVEWWHRTSVGWEGAFQLPETIEYLAFVLWAYTAWQFGFENPWSHSAFVTLGLMIALALFYSSYRFRLETKEHDPHQARSLEYRGWPGMLAFGISIVAAVIATFFGANIYQAFFIALSGACVEVVRLLWYYLALWLRPHGTRPRR